MAIKSIALECKCIVRCPCLVIDSTDGTVERDGTNVLNNVGGTFLQLLAGDNAITYTGPLGTITVDYTQRWL